MQFTQATYCEATGEVFLLNMRQAYELLAIKFIADLHESLAVNDGQFWIDHIIALCEELRAVDSNHGFVKVR